MLEHVSPTQIHISAGPALPLLMHITEGTLGMSRNQLLIFAEPRQERCFGKRVDDGLQA